MSEDLSMLGIAKNTLDSFRETGQGHWLDNADADVLRDMVRLAVKEVDRAWLIVDAEISVVGILQRRLMKANPSYVPIGYDDEWRRAPILEQFETARQELFECLQESGADTSSIACYEEPWRHVQAGEAAKSVAELRRDYEECPTPENLKEALEALDMAIYHADNLQRVRNKLPVRDLDESGAGLNSARKMLEKARSNG